ncbi:MAG: LysM peptidoglycan-binding domain-containing protein [Chloroflexota bacterium]
MKTNRATVLLIVALILVVGVACTRSVPGAAPKATDTPGPVEEQPGNPTDVMNQIYTFATQTAISAQGVIGTPVPGGEQPADGTPAAPVDPNATGAAPLPTQPGVISPVDPQPTSAPAVVLPAPTAGPAPASYALQKGEHPFCIARRFNVDPAELLRLNGLSTYSVVSVGMVLRIPQSGATFPGGRSLQAHPTTYTVSGNDTIYSIACAFGDVDPLAIAYVNGLQPPYRLTPGTTLQIP